MKINLFTIGFTQKKAEKFFNILKSRSIKRIIDIRLNNVSQLAGFAKKDDLKYFLKIICDCDYIHMPELAPTNEILNNYKKKIISWDSYDSEYTDLLEKRKAEEKISPKILDNACFLCSEPSADHCHRRLAAEYLANKLNNIHIIHL